MNMPAEDPARNKFLRFSLKRSLGSGLVSIAFRRSETSGRMDTEFGGQVIAFERDNSSTIGAGLTTQLSKLRKRHILKFFPCLMRAHFDSQTFCLKQMLEVQDGGLEHPRGHLIHALFPCKFDEIIAKFAQLTPQERAKRKLESLEVLRKTFKKLGHDIGVKEFLDASDPSVEELDNQVKVLRSRLTEVEKKLSWWTDPDMINKVEHLTQMECALRESLNAVHVQELGDTTHFHLLMGREQERETHPLHPANKSQHMPFPEAPNSLPQEDRRYSQDISIATCSNVLNTGKELEVDQARQATTAVLDTSVFDDLTSIASLREQLSEQYPYNLYDSPNLLEKNLDSQSEINLEGYLMDHEVQRNFDLPRSVDSINSSWDSAAGTSTFPSFDEKAYRQQGNSSR